MPAPTTQPITIGTWTLTERRTGPSGSDVRAVAVLKTRGCAADDMVATVTVAAGVATVEFWNSADPAYAVAEAARLVAQTYDTVGDLNSDKLHGGEGIAPILDVRGLTAATLRFANPDAFFILAAYFGGDLDFIVGLS